MTSKRPSDTSAGQGRAAPPPVSRRRAYVGAPALIALASALAVSALAASALLIPGFVLPASAETTSSTQATPTVVTLPVAPTPAEPAAGRKLVTLPWGSEPGQVGLTRAGEGLTRGPEALAVAPDGRIAVLDSVNSRVLVLTSEGATTGALPLTLAEPRFLAVDDTSIYVLDADADHQLVAMDWHGGLLHSAQVADLDDVATGLFVTTDGPCVEVAHDHVYLVEFKDTGAQAAAVAGKAGKPAAAALHGSAGRPLDRDLGKAVKLTFKPKEGMKVKRYKVDKKSLKGEQTQAAAPVFRGGRPIEHLVSVDGDGRGGLIIGARLLRAKSDPRDGPSLIIGRLAAGSSADAPPLTGSLLLSDSSYAYLGQPYTVAPDGRVFQPVGSDQGYTIMIYSLPVTQEVQP